LFAAAQLAFNARQLLMAILRRSHGAADVESLSQYLQSLGIDLHSVIHDKQNRPVPLVEGGQSLR
jgi:hypothetical protein